MVDTSNTFGISGDAMRRSGARMAEGGVSISTKLLNQAEQNAREAFAAIRAAAPARDLAEVMQVQGDYLRNQGSRSLAQAQEIAELIARIGEDAVGPPQDPE